MALSSSLVRSRSSWSCLAWASLSAMGSADAVVTGTASAPATSAVASATGQGGRMLGNKAHEVINLARDASGWSGDGAAGDGRRGRPSAPALGLAGDREAFGARRHGELL